MIRHLVLASDVKFGGFVTFTEHLASGAGHRFVLRLGKRSGACRPCGSKRSVMVTPDGIPPGSIITAVDWKAHGDGVAIAVGLGLVSAVVFHDPNDAPEWALRLVSDAGVRCVFIRKSQVLRACGFGVVDPVVIPHPYALRDFVGAVGRRVAASVSRIDFDKHTELIVAANERGAGVDIYGGVNRLYAHHKLPAGWERWYKGEHCGGVETLSGYRFSVDMSIIKGDGGGTQYTTLEAWEAGSVPVVHHRWIIPGDEMVPGENCLSVDSDSDLLSLLNSARLGEIDEAALVQRGRESLARHDAKSVFQSLVASL